MRKNYDNNFLTNNKIDKKYWLFYLTWLESTDDQTMSTYQFKMMNPISILKETQFVLTKTMNKTYPTNHPLENCIEEAILIVKEDKVLESNQTLKRLKGEILQHLQSKRIEAKNGLNRMNNQLNYLIKRIDEEYLNALITFVEAEMNKFEAVTNSEEDQAKAAEAIMFSVSAFVSILVERGWSTKDLHSLIGILRNNDNGWEIFKNKVKEKNKRIIEIYVPVITRTSKVFSDVQEILYSKFGLQLVSAKELKLKDPNNEFLQKIKTDHEFIPFEVEAFDTFAATQIAVQKANDIFNIIKFYGMTEGTFLNNAKVVYKERTKLKTTSFENIDRAITKNGTLKEDIWQFFEAFDFSDNYSESMQVPQKIMNSYSFIRMGNESKSPHTQFISLWIALESLCNNSTSENIINHILRVVPAALAKNYLYQLVDNFINDCKRMNVLPFPDFIDGSKIEKDKKLELVIKILRNDYLYKNLLEKCNSVNCLLYYRCKKMHKLVMDKNKECYIAVEKHMKNISLQLSRLYRIRNDIAHSASISSEKLVRYIEHLNSYLTLFLVEIIKMYPKYRSLDCIFEVIVDNDHEFNEIYKTNKKAKNTDMIGFSASGIIDLI